jgi:YD repeat-containing protein
VSCRYRVFRRSTARLAFAVFATLALVAAHPRPLPAQQGPGGGGKITPQVCPVAVPIGPQPASSTGESQPTSGGKVGTLATCVWRVSVTPDGATTPARVVNSSSTATFTVQNNGSGGTTDTYSMVCGGSGGVSCISVSPSQKQLANGGQVTVTVTYGVGLTPGTGRLTLGAYGTAEDTAYYNVPIVRAYDVAVTPDGATTAQREHGQSYSETFTVANTGYNANTFSLSCTGSGGVTCGTLSQTTVSLLGNTTGTAPSMTVTVGYTVTNTGPSTVNGTLSLTATGTNATDNGYFTVPIIRHSLAVTPDGTTPQDRVAGEGPYTATFAVRNTGTVSDTYTLTCGQTATVSGCNITSPGSSLTLASGAGPANVTVSYNVTATGSGTLTLSAASPSASDGGRIDINGVTRTAQAPAVSTADVNPGSTVERSLCLTVALSQAAAAECGDLRIVHALPTTKTMNKARTPTLLYNSNFAHPYPLIAAIVTLPLTAQRPDNVTADLTLTGTGLATVRGTWPGTEWQYGQARRLVVGLDALGLATGVYSYTLEVRNWYGQTSQLTAVTGQAAIVNRSASPFGAGWWLAGLERLTISGSNPILWVGGDGSVRQYTQVPGSTTKWVAPNVDHPDTLIKDGSGNYLRLDKDSVWVTFDASGQHIRTRNRQNHVTTFAYTSGRLSTITLPTPSASKVYQFAYDANGKLQTVTSPPPAAAARTTTVTVASGRITAIRDPDNTTVGFGYDAAWANRIATRTDRRGTVTTFGIDPGKRISQASLDMGATQPAIVTRLTPLESRGLANSGTPSSVDTALAYARLDGPRTDVGDTTLFWLDRFGAPVKIMDAPGNTTYLTRGGGTPSWPGLVSRIQYPRATPTSAPQMLGATYDARGNLTSVTDSSTTSGGRYATTTYAWDTKWDAVTRVTQPEGDFVAFSYDVTTGNRLWQEDGRGSLSRVTFGYNAYRQLTTIAPPNTPAQRIGYDATTGNIVADTSSKGYVTSYQSDGTGRITKIRSPIDTAAAPTLFQTRETFYDFADRDTLVIRAGSAMSSVGVESVFVRTVRNPDGQPTLVSRRTVPNSANVGTVINQWRYDAAGRPIAEIAPDGQVDSTAYDPAGNRTARVTRRGHRIAMAYDVLNRLSTRTLPAFTYAQRAAADLNPNYDTLSVPFPAYAVPAEIQSFTYDNRGRLLTADNLNAKVKRSYFENGLLRTDSLRIATGDRTDFARHAYGLEHAYDLDGRPVSSRLPDQLTSLTQVTYQYDPQMAALTLVDHGGVRYTLQYNGRGELRSIVYPNGYEQTWGYDGDGRTVADTLWNRGSLSDPRLPASSAGVVWANALSYDARGRLLRRYSPAIFYDLLTLRYSGLGSLVGTDLTQQGTNAFNNPATYYLSESFAYDPLGNRTFASTSWTRVMTGFSESDGTPDRFATYAPTTGRLASEGITGNPMTYSYDGAGNTEYSLRVGSEQRASFYGADGALLAVDWRWVGPGDIATWKTAFEEYRYDALGRRVWTQATKRCAPNNINAQTWLAWHSVECMTSLVRRTVWDGAQEVAEIQMPAATSDLVGGATYAENDTDPVDLPLLSVQGSPGQGDRNPLFGRVVYTQALGLDRPLGVTRHNYVFSEDYYNYRSIRPSLVYSTLSATLFWSVQGDPEIAAFVPAGERRLCVSLATNDKCVAMPLLLYWSAYDRLQGFVSGSELLSEVVD